MNAVTEQLTDLIGTLERIADTLDRLADATATLGLPHLDNSVQAIAAALDANRPAPGYRAPLADYPAFAWSQIGADVVATDAHGATLVNWRGRTYRRRTHPKYGTHIWFSRGAGRDEDGSVSYERLITFGPDADADELPPAIAKALPPRTTPAPTPAPALSTNALDRAFPRPAQDDPDAGPDFEDGSPDRPADDEFDRAFPRPAQETDVDPRAAFYRALPNLLSTGAITPTQANELTRIAKADGFARALEQALVTATANGTRAPEEM